MTKGVKFIILWKAFHTFPSDLCFYAVIIELFYNYYL